ncbi:hypothetical protein NRB56_39950 [Nocardia sp. RB56]|uniref:Aminoglycoside phosphotransferase domain-containing protein n=2 Tax=Nocardia aurantia TaxID=2585199 RepID=A0A7K0DRQ0_9NOCA|nr:hypothetical protein [Nocardia aurantia]
MSTSLVPETCGTPRLRTRKWCTSADGNEAESAWVAAAEWIRPKVGHFRPVSLRPADETAFDAGVSHRAPVTMEGVQGVSLFELACALNMFGQRAESQVVAGRVLGEIVHDSLASLAQFRMIANSGVTGLPRTCYPYSEQGISALCALTDIVDSESLPGAVEDIRRLGAWLEARSTEAFRDAHLKNRIWVTSETAEELVVRLCTASTDDLRAEIMGSVVDVDFESTCRDVTQWDDVAHILFFEMSGFDPLVAERDVLREYEKCWGPVGDREELLRTVLMRSTREACRRLWYADKLPRTYLRRYAMESTDTFLDLAAWAAGRLDDVDHLARLLAYLRQAFEHQPHTVPYRRYPHIPALLP